MGGSTLCQGLVEQHVMAGYSKSEGGDLSYHASELGVWNECNARVLRGGKSTPPFYIVLCSFIIFDVL